MPIADKLLDIAFTESESLQEDCSLEKIAEFLVPNEKSILDGINEEFSLNLTSLQDAAEILENQRYIRLAHLIDSKFTYKQILKSLNLISSHEDEASEIQKLMTDNTDVPTNNFECVLLILLYKTSHFDYIKLSLDIDLLPKTHVAGGEVDGMKIITLQIED